MVPASVARHAYAASAIVTKALRSRYRDFDFR